MDTLMSPEFITRHINSAYAAVVPAVVLVGAAAIYGSRTPSAPAVKVGSDLTAEFSFKDGVLLPHPQYLYGYSDSGQHFLVGKKLAGHDYSGWEAQYSNYGKVDSVVTADSTSKATWSWTLPTPKTFPTLTFLQLLLCFLLGAVCALLVRYAARKAFSRLYRRKHNKHEYLAMPSSDIDAEYAKLNNLWRRTLISMYRDRKTEIMSLIKLAVHFYESSCNLKEDLAERKKREGEAKSALEKSKAEYADKFAQQQNEIERLREMLDTQIALAHDLKLSNEAVAAENTIAKDTIKSLEEQIIAMQTEKHVEPIEIADLETAYLESATEQDDDSPASENQSAGLELGNNVGNPEDEHITAEAADAEAEGTEGAVEQDSSPASDHQDDNHDWDDNEGSSEVEYSMAEAADMVAEGTEGATEQDDHSPVFDDQGNQDLNDNEGSFEGEHSMTEETNPKVEATEDATEQDDHPPAPADQNIGVELTASGKPRKQRANRRADGTIRTQTHPDYVPRPQPQPQRRPRAPPGVNPPAEVPPMLGDHPVNPPGRGNGYWGGNGGGRGGGAGNRGRGGEAGEGRGRGWNGGRGGNAVRGGNQMRGGNGGRGGGHGGAGQDLRGGRARGGYGGGYRGGNGVGYGLPFYRGGQ